MLHKNQISVFEGENPQFENLSHQNGMNYWTASLLMTELGYSEFNIRAAPILKAFQVCVNTGIDPLEHFIYFDNEKNGKKFKDIKGIYSTVSSYLLSLITVINMKDYFDIVNEIFKDEMLNKNTLYIVNSNINLKRRIETNKSKNYLNYLK